MLLTDADEVLLDWLNPFHDFIKESGIKTFTKEPESWHLDEWIDHHSVFDLVETFNKSENFKNLKPLPEAVKYVSMLSEYQDIVVITSCGRYCEDARFENLKFWFGEHTFKDIVCLPTGSKKYDILSQYEPSYWVDDNYQNTVDGSFHGHYSMMYERTYNKDLDHENIVKVSNWKEIYDIIKGTQDELNFRDKW